MKTQLRFLFTALLLAGCLFGFAGCGFLGGKTMFGQKAPAGWNTHQDPRGFSIHLPRGWKASVADSGRIDLTSAANEQIVIWPVFLQTQVSDAIASSALRSLASKIRPDVTWQSFAPTQGNTRRMLGQSGQLQAMALFTWANNPKGATGYVYTVTAPAAQYQKDAAMYAQILQSFRLTGTTKDKTPTQPALTYVPWQDPRENAFSLEVPSNWRVEGGTYRYAAMDARFALIAQSPDNQIRITSGDAELPYYALPTDADRFIGNTSGTVDLLGYQAVFRPYLGGENFALDYVQNKVARGLSDLRFTRVQPRPDLAQAISAIYVRYEQMGLRIKYEAGEVAFTCRSGNQPLQGYYQAITWFMPGTTGGALWKAEYLFGYVATNEKAAEADEALTRMVQSSQINPQWLARQQGLSRHAAKIGSETIAAISETMFQNYQNHVRGRDEHMRRVTNAIAGTEDVVDPNTGTQYNIYSGSNYYWIDRGGTIIGTNTYDRPDIDFREMVRLP